jgi:hypothetical protein
MYRVNEQIFRFYSDALTVAKSTQSPIVDVATGLIRWEPLKVSRKSQRRYQERLNAYNARQSVSPR